MARIPVDTAQHAVHLLQTGADSAAVCEALDALVACKEEADSPRQNLLLRAVLRSALASPTPGALAAVLARGLRPPAHDHAPLLAHSAFLTVHPEQHQPFLDLLEEDVARAQADPTGPVASRWYAWSVGDPVLASLFLAYGLGHDTTDPNRPGLRRTSGTATPRPWAVSCLTALAGHA